MKSFINQKENIVNEAIDGFLSVNDKLAKLNRFPEIKVVVRNDWDKSKVAIISGGGSGHEPSHTGFIGEGMLTAAVCGEVFASPSVDAVLSAILAVTGEAGCLLIIKNYTGDRLNFGLAAEQARALGYKVETVIVADDIALGKDVKQRGIAGTVFMHKVTGYYAAKGKSLDEIVQISQNVIQNTASIGLAINECQLFGGQKEIRLQDDEAELGLGIHGEPGAEVIKIDSADELMKTTINKLEKHYNDSSSRFAILINNLGTATPIEMNILANAFTKTNFAKQTDYIVGPGLFMTALNMTGFSISAIKLTPEIEEALLADVEPQAWLKAHKLSTPLIVKSPQLSALIPFEASENEDTKDIITKIANTFISIEEKINELDAKVGDGDAGATFSAASQTILKLIDQLPLNNVSQTLESIGRIFSREAGGSSGVLMSILFTAAGNYYDKDAHLGKALLDGLNKLKEYGGAKVGDRTMIDALEPAFTLLADGESIQEAASAARAGTESTKQIKKTLYGRSSYIPEELLNGVQDPGAEAMTRVLEDLAK